MSTDEGAAAVAKAPPPATQEDWESVYDWARVGDRFAPCVLELRDRVAALEAAAKSAAAPAGKTNPQWLGGVAVPNSDGWIVTQVQSCAAAPAGVSVKELVDCLPVNAWAGPEGYSRQAFARHLLDHPRIGPLLRGEGAGAPKRVVLPEKPSMPGLYWVGHDYRDGYRDAWAAARAEVERQQQGGQADG